MSSEQDARARDAADELPTLRDRFHIPPYGDAEAAYFAGNSLGLQPKALRARLAEELDDWARLGVEGTGRPPGPGSPTTNCCARRWPGWSVRCRARSWR
jgi:kynureninase